MWKTFSIVISSVLVLVKSDCRDLTLDDCDYGTLGPFETSKGLDQNVCQRFCNEIYSGKCKFFIYDRKQEICELFDYEAEDYASTCEIIAATPMPNIETCFNTSDDCDVSYFLTLLFSRLTA